MPYLNSKRKIYLILITLKQEMAGLLMINKTDKVKSAFLCAMDKNTLQVKLPDTEFSFYTTSSYFGSLINHWTSGCRILVEQYKHESSLLQSVSRSRSQVVVFGVDQSLLSKGLVSRMAKAAHRPVIVALIKTYNESEITECYAQGADRVVVVENCTARIFQALLGRLAGKDKYFPPYLINHSIQTIKFAGIEVRLTKKTFDLAQYLFVNHGKVLSKSKILFDLWGMDSKQCLTHRIEVHVSHIRRLLELDGTHDWEIRAQRSLGYGIFRRADSY